MKNYDDKTIASFGDEWTKFDQSILNNEESIKIFNDYFNIFPWNKINISSEGFDMGCGSGRWARFILPKVGLLHCIDPSKALEVAKKNLISFNNTSFHNCIIEEVQLKPNSQDFGYSLGVLHHVPDTQKAINSCVYYLKSGAPLLIYLYYSFDNKPWWYRLIWKTSNILRKFISITPNFIKNIITDIIAISIYYPIAKINKFLDKLGLKTTNFPLSYYKDHTFYTMRTDSRDRFGTPLEHRFSKKQINEMLLRAGLVNIEFSDNAPFWCVVGYKE